MTTEFFRQLAGFSSRYVDRVIGDEARLLSPWRGGDWPDGHPNGAIVHYTADEDLRRVLRWFLVERYDAQVSAHCVVGLGWDEDGRELVEEYPLVGDLPVMVVQCVPPTERAWHARRWVNDDFYGIEVCNAGELRCDDGVFYTWRPRDRGAKDWTTPWDRPDGQAIPLLGRWWAPYTDDQVRTVLALLRAVDELHGGTVVVENVVGHECVQENKRDPGPAFPMSALRGAFATGEESELFDFAVDFMWPQLRIDRLVAEYDDAESTDLMLRLLGYAGGDPASIALFQRMTGLETDSVAGPVTRRAINSRLRDLGFRG